MRAWSHDINAELTPLEAGLGFMVDWTKEFRGKEALLKQKKEGLTRRLATFIIEDAEAMPWGDEPIHMNGQIVGGASSATFGHSVGSGVCLGYITHPDVQTKGFLSKQSFQI